MAVPGMGASSAALMYFPQFKALFYGEDTASAIHDICTLGVSKIRDAKNRWKALDQAIQRYEDKIEILFSQHHWPRIGKENIKRFLARECRNHRAKGLSSRRRDIKERYVCPSKKRKHKESGKKYVETVRLSNGTRIPER